MSNHGLQLLVLLYALISVSSQFSTAADTIATNQSISDSAGQTLVSSGETFILGFFSLTNSKNRYLGIWYKKKNSSIAWVANRNEPLIDSSGVLTIGLDGNIVLLNGSKSVIWSSSSSKSVEKPVAQLLDSGNLVLKDEMLNDSDNYLWQSFDYPSHMLLPDMKQGWDFKVGLHRYLTSWKNREDPATGDFSYSIDLTGLPQLVLRNGLDKVFRSGAWNGVYFSGPYFRSNSFVKAEFISNADEAYYKNTAITSILTGFTLDPWGTLRHVRWDNKSLDWAIMFEMSRDQCDNYNTCGVNGVCNDNVAPACGCLQGFIPKSQHEFNRTGGCVRRAALSCGSGDRFIPIKAVKLPDMVHFWVNKNLSLKECEVECFKNCSCMAFANSDITEGGSGCVLWFDELFDVVQLTGDGEQNLYIRLAESELAQISETNKKKRRVVVAISVSVSLAMLLLGLFICSIIWKMWRNKRGNVGSQKEDVELPLFDLITIVDATDNFSSTNKIGQGGFGPVYKGKLIDGQEIAVKKLSKGSGQGLTEFKNEVILIAKLQHRNLVRLLGCCIQGEEKILVYENLVRLLGCCIQGEEKILVYEYMPNESLDYFVFDQKRSSLLAWEQRLDIVMGIARGLLYLHQDSRLRIIHRDLKTSNVLLDSHMKPKISDFGMARVFGGDQIEADTNRVVGTYGYMSPEYAIDGHFSVKSDVFSFGVLVLEMISGKKNRGFNHEDHYHNLLGHAWILWKAGKALELIETSWGDSCSVSEVMKCIQVGLLCVQKLPEDRPNMSSVVIMLGSENASLPEPKQPGFFVERSSNITSMEESNTGNLVTISILEAR